MDINVARQAIDAYARLVQGQEKANIMIRFYGGEPLLNWRMIEQALSYGRQLFNGKTEVQWILNTNGTLLVPEIASVLKREGVDVHISIDGADEASNKYRKFKNGKPVLNQVLKSLEILKREDCRVQIDSCLTDANLHSLHGLIDLAVDAGADRIFLALTNCPQDQHPLDIELTTRKILDTVNYAEQKGISLGTPWTRVLYGLSENMVGLRNQAPPLVIEPTGEVSFLAYREKKLGQVEELEKILISPLFIETIEGWEREKRSCRDCELGSSCNGNLKAMVMYHTGGVDGHERECQLAMSILDGLKTFANRKLVLSRQLIGQYHQERSLIMNRLAGTSINSTPEILNFLDLFKNPTTPASLYARYSRPDLWPTTSHFMNINFLIPEDIDEEAQWLEGKVGPEESKIFETEHFFTYYPDSEGYLARDFAALMEDAYRLLNTKGIPHLKKKIPIFVCQSRAQFKQFWGSPPLPEWVKAFVHLGRILVVGRQKILPINRKSTGFLWGMAHELVHIFLNEEYTYLPTWMEEGLCEYYSRPYNDSKFKKIVRERRLYGFREMEAFVKHSLLDLDDSPVRENICYQQAHSFVHFIARLAGEKDLVDCIRATGLSKDFRKVFEEYYGRSLDDMEVEWREKYSSVNYKKIKPSKNKVLLYNAFYGQSLMTNNDMLDLLDYMNEGKTINEINEGY
jgi:sulfatase maturation enzyme AslB (radical SAM superfamily)